MALSGSHSEPDMCPSEKQWELISYIILNLSTKNNVVCQKCDVWCQNRVLTLQCNSVTLLRFEQKPEIYSSCFAFQISTFTEVSWRQKQKVCTAYQLPVPPFCAKGASKQPFVVNNEIMKQFWCYTYCYFVTFSALRWRWPTGTATRKSNISVLCRFNWVSI